jgi:sporulation-control protein spo0M
LTARELWDTDLEQRSMDAVHTELAKMGLGSANVQMVYWEEMCWYPGGNFPARTITVQTPNGGKADFDAGLTLLTPHVTARDVACLLRGAPMEG